MGQYFTNEEVEILIEQAKNGDNTAWQKLYENFDKYIYKLCWSKLKNTDWEKNYKERLLSDLHMAGQEGFFQAVRHYDTTFTNRAKFITYATKWIEGEITEEWSFHNRFISVKKRLEETGVIEEDVNEPEVLEETIEDICDNMQIGEKYNAERRTLQILEILKLMTDENHRVNKEELKNLLRHYRMAKYENFAKPESPTTFTSTLESILLEVDPQEYSEEREQDYRIRYEGYKEDRLRRKLAKELKGKGAEITGFSYVHTFSYAQLDALIELVCLTDILSADEKSRIVEKLVGTASEYYESPFWNKRSKKIKFNVKAIHGRFSGRQNESSQLAENIRTIQYAVNNLCQIRFRFNRYTVEKNMTPTSEYMHTLSVYHLVVYHDRYYCIGLKAEDMRIWHYRVDLMSDIEIMKDDEGNTIPIEICNVEGLPIFNSKWDPKKYMAEHLYMAYDEPKNILIKIRNNNYTILHDWFGDHYEKVDEVTGADEEGNEIRYDIVKVRTSPSMIVHWAMQYGDTVEIMDEEIRKKIRREIEKMTLMYGRDSSE